MFCKTSQPHSHSTLLGGDAKWYHVLGGQAVAIIGRPKSFRTLGKDVSAMDASGDGGHYGLAPVCADTLNGSDAGARDLSTSPPGYIDGASRGPRAIALVDFDPTRFARRRYMEE